jgi:hypothetical protein
MVRSTEVIEKVKNAVSLEDRKFLDIVFSELEEPLGRRSRKSLLNQINNLLIEAALKNNRPSILTALPEIPGSEIDSLFSKIVHQFILTKDASWLDCLVSLSGKLGKKSYQSRVFAMMAHDLIEAGVSEGNPFFIDQGVTMLDRVIFRKYRSDIMIDIIPLLIVWAITKLDEKLLYRSLKSIEEISDISKRAVLHAELAKAIATIAVLKKNNDLFLESIRIATKIHQKIRRQNCISAIIEKGTKSVFGNEMFDIRLFIHNFPDISNEESLEIISALNEQLLERVKNKDQITAILRDLCQDNPRVSHTIVTDLFRKAEKSGEFWYLSSAMQLLQITEETDEYPIREMVRAGISVARSSNNMQIIKDLIPIIDKKCNIAYLSKTYLQFSQIMLSSGDFSSALEVFSKISNKTEYQSQYVDILTSLIKCAIVNDRIQQVKTTTLDQLDKEIVNNVIYRTIVEMSKDQPFDEIISHIKSVIFLISLHPKKDHLFLECITHLINRGFLDSNDPAFLIELVEFISNPNLKERAISTIVIKIARIGVQTRNRDFLQRAVGLTCEIEGQKTRSVTLSSIIDEASILAAQEGDLDLLLRMRDWSSTLLEKDLATYALANIIEGVLKYAIGRHSSDALEQAYLIADNIPDPVLRAQLFDRISECFVKIGCITLKGSKYGQRGEDFEEAFHSFERGLEIIKGNVKGPQISLKIAGMLDIMITYSRTSENPDYIVALAMYTLEIENSFERDAMMYRIISNLNDNIPHPNSTDPYEIISYLLQRNEHAKDSPKIIRLILEIVDKISNEFIKLSGFCTIADLSIKSRDYNQAYLTLTDVYKSHNDLQTEYEKILILSDLTILFSLIDKKMAGICLREGIKYLENVELDKNAQARKQIVMAIASLHAVDPNDELKITANQVASKIVDPVDYIHSLIAIHRINEGDRDRRKEILHQMLLATDNISSPYDKATILLEVFPLSLADCEDDTPVAILKKAEIITKKINVQYISDIILDTIAEIFLTLHKRKNKTSYLSSAIEVTKSIDNDDIRLHRQADLGYQEVFDIQPSYMKIRNLSEKIAAGKAHSNQIASLERLIRSVADRGKEAVFFCDCALLFRKEGEEKLSKRMMQSAIKEARIIRPLSRRAYVMCDIAMKISEVGCEREAQEILDLAIDAATNIRQSPLRDEVFEELGLAIKIIQEM